MRTLLGFTFGLLATAQCTAQLASWAPPLLLRVDYLLYGSLCPSEASELLLYRDRLVIEKAQELSRVRIVIYEAPPEALLQLSEALTAGRIGLVSGTCTTGDFLPNGSFLKRIDWLGRSDRHTTFRLGSLGTPGPPCPAEVLALEHAIEVYLARARETTPLVELELPHPGELPCL